MRMADDEDSEARENNEPTDTAHVIRVFDDPAEIDAATWDALVAAQPSATPFVSMAYLRALHESASAVADTGWAPHFLVLERALGLAAGQRHEPPRPVMQEPDPGVAAGQARSMRRERPGDLVELDSRRQVAGELEQRVLTTGGRHLTHPIGRAAAALERTRLSERRGGAEAPTSEPRATLPSARRGTSGRPAAPAGSSRRRRNPVT